VDRGACGKTAGHEKFNYNISPESRQTGYMSRTYTHVQNLLP